MTNRITEEEEEEEKVREKRFQIQENLIHTGEGFTPPQKETDANVNPAKGHS